MDEMTFGAHLVYLKTWTLGTLLLFFDSRPSDDAHELQHFGRMQSSTVWSSASTRRFVRESGRSEVSHRLIG